jgi:bifunctional non-homologous end joining protein LigD
MIKVPEGRRSSARFLARMLPGAVAAPLGDFIPPAVPVSKPGPPKGPGWVHEILFEGIRLQVAIEKGRVALRGSSGEPTAPAFARIARAAAALPVNRARFDGVAIVQGPDGASDRSLLEGDLAACRSDRLVFFAFDLLHLDGFDISAAPLVERKCVLAALLAEAASGIIAFSAHATGDGRDFLAEVKAMGLAGLVSKRADAAYAPGSNGDWVAVRVAVKSRHARK